MVVVVVVVVVYNRTATATKGRHIAFKMSSYAQRWIRCVIKLVAVPARRHLRCGTGQMRPHRRHCSHPTVHLVMGHLQQGHAMERRTAADSGGVQRRHKAAAHRDGVVGTGGDGAATADRMHPVGVVAAT
ncbi:hypothetical protein Vretifemale_10283 [Volvox reticuliferus]|uniref:Uncharacterized protein n=1 Tax=Volvox reticuliferus TaxID=1737510 RepID=A0A8J4CGC5_9CHLO|nr:hypothetical protein Vretifemale_10283 [Volvox reticuliferus]